MESHTENGYAIIWINPNYYLNRLMTTCGFVSYVNMQFNIRSNLPMYKKTHSWTNHVRDLNIVTFTQTWSMHQHHQTIDNHKQSPPMLIINKTEQESRIKERVAGYLTQQSSFVKFIRRNLEQCGGKAVADKIWIAGAIQYLCGHRRQSRNRGPANAASQDVGER